MTRGYLSFLKKPYRFRNQENGTHMEEAILFETPYQKGNLSINIEPHLNPLKMMIHYITIFDISNRTDS